MKKPRKVFIICPVRNSKPEVQARIKDYVAELEAKGYQVHWPARDTNQNDITGLYISTQNGTALLAADEVHIWYDPESQGSIFDLGVLFSRVINQCTPKFVIANRDAVIPTTHKSYANLILTLAQYLR